VRVKGRGTVGTNDPQVLDAIVVGDSVDVIEDQRHARAAPLFILAAKLAFAAFHALGIEALLQVAARVGGAFNQDLLEWLTATIPAA